MEIIETYAPHMFQKKTKEMLKKKTILKTIRLEGPIENLKSFVFEKNININRFRINEKPIRIIYIYFQ